MLRILPVHPDALITVIEVAAMTFEPEITEADYAARSVEWQAVAPV